MPHAVCVLVCALLTSNLFMAFYQFYFHSSLGSGILLFFFDPSAIRFCPHFDPFDSHQLGTAARLLAYPLNATCAPLVRRAFWPRQALQARFDPLKLIKPRERRLEHAQRYDIKASPE